MNLNEKEIVDQYSDGYQISYSDIFDSTKNNGHQLNFNPLSQYDDTAILREITVRSDGYFMSAGDWLSNLWNTSNSNQSITVFKIGEARISFCVAHYYDTQGIEIQIPFNFILFPNQPPTAGSISSIFYYLKHGWYCDREILLDSYLAERMDGDDDIVYLCEDLRVAKHLSGIISDSKRYSDRKLLATSWYGGSRLMKSVNLSSLWDKSIVFVPSINRNSFASGVFEIEKRCQEATVRSFKIFNMAILPNRLPIEDIGIAEELVDPWERSIAKNAIDLGKCESYILKGI